MSKITNKYGNMTFNELKIQDKDFKDRVLVSEPLSLNRQIYNTTIELSIMLRPGEANLINPGNIMYVDIEYGDSNYKFYTMIEGFSIDTMFLNTDDPFIVYKISTMNFNSVLSRRTIYGNVYSITDNNGKITTMPILQRKMRKLSDIDVLLDRGDKESIKEIQGWDSLITPSHLDNMIRPDVDDEYYVKLKQEVIKKYKINKENYFNIKYSKNKKPLMAGDIVKDYCSKFLADEGITLGRIDDGVDIWETDIEDFDTVSLKHVMDELSNASGYVWFVDDNMKINFFKDIDAYGDVKLKIEKSNINDFVLLNASKSIQGYYNKVFIRGGEPYEDIGEDMLDMSGNIKYIKELPVEIQKQKELTGMSGVHGITHMNNRIHTIKDASDLSNNLLGRAGRLPNTLEILTHNSNIDILDKVELDLKEINMVGIGVVTNLKVQWFMNDDGEDKGETIITVEPISMLSNLQENWVKFMDKIVMNINNLGKTVTQIKNGAPSGGNSLDYSLTDSPIIADQDDPEIPVDPDPDPGEIPPAPGRVNDLWIDFTNLKTVSDNQVLNSFNKTQLAGTISGRMNIVEETETSHSYIDGVDVYFSEYYKKIPMGTIFAVVDLSEKSRLRIWGDEHKRDKEEFSFLSEYYNIWSSGVKTPDDLDPTLGSPTGFNFLIAYYRNSRKCYQSKYDYANLYHNGRYIPSIPRLKRQYGFQIIGFNSGKGIDKDTTIISTPQIWHTLNGVATRSVEGYSGKFYEFIAYNRVLSEKEYKQTYNYLCNKYNKKDWII